MQKFNCQKYSFKNITSLTGSSFSSLLNTESQAVIDPCQKLNNTLKSQIGFKYSRKNLTPLPSNFLQRVRESIQNNKRPLVLLNTGAYCPPHFGHFDALINAKDFLENNFNYQILSIYLSPAQDVYLKYKAAKQGFQKFILNFKERADMLEWTKEYYEKNAEIIVDRWEGNQPFFIHFPNVWISLQYYLEKTLLEQGATEEIKVGFVVGDDMLQTQIDITYKFLRLERITYELPLIIYGREETKPSALEQRLEKYKSMPLQEMDQKKLYYVLDSEKQNYISSSFVRNLIEED